MRHNDQEQKPRKIRLAREGYPYSYARVCAMRAALLPRSEYQKLLKMELNGLIRYLQESGYRTAIDRLGSKFSGIELIEHALNDNMVETAQKLRRITPEELNVLIDVFMARWDVHNLKTVARAIASRADKEQVRSLFVPAGKLTLDDLDRLLDSASIEEALAGQGLPQGELKQAIAKEREGGSLMDLENLLDKEHFRKSLEVAQGISAEGAPFRDFLMEEIDIVNIKTLLRLKRIGMGAQEIESHMIPGGSRLDARTLSKLARSASAESAEAALAKTVYGEAFGKGHTPVDLELALEKLLMKRSFLSTRHNPLSVMSIMHFMLAKVTEMNNLRMLVKAKQLGLEDEFIEQKLVVA